jgi:hypothetical protein
MEFIIVLVALAIAYAVYRAYFVKPAEVVEEAVPYKVEEPVVVVEAVVEAPAKKTRKPAAPKAPKTAKATAKKTAVKKPKAK